MKDLDFDELDKAVHSLMGGVKPQADDRDPQKTLAIAPTLNEDEQPAYEKVEEVAKKIGSETITLPSEGASADRVIEVPTSKGRSGGRFMDVMHPSADMKSASPSPAAPVKSVSVASTPQQKPNPVVELPHVDKEEKAEVVAPEKSEPKEVASPEAPQVVAAPAPAETAVTAVAPVEPLSTPFLADAKVEKRPLGGAPTETSEMKSSEATELTDDVTSVDDAPATDSTAQLPLAPEKIVSVPDEYHDALLAIESQGSLELGDESEVATPEASTTVSEPVAAPSPESTDAVTPLEKSGAIYDVNDYHQPLNHPAKHPSGWLWVILTILLIAIGGGAAAAFYLLTS